MVLKMYGRTLQSIESLIQSKTGLIESKHVPFTKVVRRLLSTEVLSPVSKLSNDSCKIETKEGSVSQ